MFVNLVVKIFLVFNELNDYIITLHMKTGCDNTMVIACCHVVRTMCATMWIITLTYMPVLLDYTSIKKSRT